jgi:antitoxin HicB
MKKHPNIGSSLDDFLDQDDSRVNVDAAAIKRVFALQIEIEMRRRMLTKTALARRMHTSRVAVDRLLDPTSGSVMLTTQSRVASALGRQLKVQLA